MSNPPVQKPASQKNPSPSPPTTSSAQNPPSYQNPPSPKNQSASRPLHPTIEIVNGYKHFGVWKKWNQVMKNVNLTAYPEQIYVLLGPGGSGKSTILNIILGYVTLSEGTVTVFGFTPGNRRSGCPGQRIGYAPQINGLFQVMTINEVFRYYGRMLRLKSKYVNQRIAYVSELLALPAGNRWIHQCTEEEKRMISFAISILHEPELLLLDEPGSGADPVHRASIWEHLHTLVKKGVTVIVTTQDVNDANKADRVGILRNGYMLMEDSPKELLKEHNEKTFETLYAHVYALKIRKQVEEKKSISEHPRVRIERISATGSEGFIYIENEADKELKNQQKHRNKLKLRCRCFKNFLKILPNCKRLWFILLRDILVTFRSYSWLLALFLTPIILLIIFSFTIGRTPKNLNIGLLNLEANRTECTERFDEYISCQLLTNIDTDILNIKHYSEYKDAKDDAHKLKISGILIVGERFTNQIMRTMANIALNNVKLGIPDTAQLILKLDMTSNIVANAIEHAVKRAVEKYLFFATKHTKIRNATIGYPMKVGKPIFGQATSEDTEYICTGLTVVLLYHLASVVAALTIVSYRTLNLATRDYVSGVRVIESLLSHMMIYGTLLFIEGILMYGVLILIRSLPMKGSIAYLILSVLVQVWCGLSFGYLIASTTKTSVQAGYVVFCCLCASLILCGVFWPLNGQPEWLLTLVKLLPQTQAICAVRCIVQRGISITNEEVYLGIIIPLIWLVIFVLITYLLTK